MPSPISVAATTLAGPVPVPRDGKEVDAYLDLSRKLIDNEERTDRVVQQGVQPAADDGRRREAPQVRVGREHGGLEVEGLDVRGKPVKARLNLTHREKIILSSKG